MRKFGSLAGALLVALCLIQPAHAEDAKAKGEELLRKLWETFKTDDPKELARTYASAFQSVHQDGARNAQQTIQFITDLKLSDYELSEIKVSEQGPVIVTTYFVKAAETLGGKRLAERKAARLTVFLKTDKGWQVIAHANLNPLS